MSAKDDSNNVYKVHCSMANILLIAVVIVTIINTSYGVIPTTADITLAKADILATIDANSEFSNNPEYPFIGGFVRLAFHDCVGPGHCDGCVNHSLADNAGLKRYTDELDAIYPTHQSNMSRADFYALASVTALEKATTHTTDKFTALSDGLFKVGRNDCSTSPSEDAAPDNNFPLGEFNIDETLNFFEEEFNFTAEEVVALLGAHTLGRCSADNSGFEGKWVKGKLQGTSAAHSDVLDNQFYLQLRGNWTQVSIVHGGQTKIQWQRPDTIPNSPSDGRNQPNMFLNSDLSLAWNLEPVETNGSVACDITCGEERCCPRATQTHTFFRNYVNNNTLWLSDFTDVFLKMINHNTATLVLPSN